MMRKTCFWAGVTIGLAPVATAYDWTGFYIGAEAGGGWSEAEFEPVEGQAVIGNVSNVIIPGRGIVVVPGMAPDQPTASGSGNDFGGGLIAGFNYQTGRFVLGFEGAYGLGSLDVTAVSTIRMPATILTAASDVVLTRRFEGDWNASLSLKAGYAFGDMLVYASGGVAFSDGEVTATDSFAITPGPAAGGDDIGPIVGYPSTTGTVTRSKSLTGWSLGAGVDYALSDTMVLGLSYRHTEFEETFDTSMTTPEGALTGPGIGPSVTTGDDDLTLTDDRVSLRLTFKLGRS